METSKTTVKTSLWLMIGKTISNSNLKERYQLNPIALVRGKKAFYSGHTHIPLQMGDTILMQGLWEQFHRLRNLPQPRVLTFSTPLEGQIMRPEKASLALFWLVPILYIATRVSIGISGKKFRGKYKIAVDHSIFDEIMSHVFSKALLFGKRMIVVAHKAAAKDAS